MLLEENSVLSSALLVVYSVCWVIFPVFVMVYLTSSKKIFQGRLLVGLRSGLTFYWC